MKKVIIFGSTGSIGKNALNVIRKNTNEFRVIGLCTNRNIEDIDSQIKEFNPLYVCVVDEASARLLEPKLIKKNIKLFKGEDGLKEFSSIACDISVMAISGVFALKPLMINIEYAKRIALANKEAIVTAGEFVFKKAKKFKTEIIPVDSEINALFQIFKPKDSIDKVYITASGGALLGYSKNDLDKVNVQEVLSHPTWRMGRRITVDSATLVNKGFEVIETHYFFNLPYEDIGIVLHRESIVHAFVEFKDKTLFACMYPPDMCMPISFALNYPKRRHLFNTDNFKNSFSLTFKPLDKRDFALLSIILDAAKKKDNSLAVLNGCDEVAVDYFLREKIKFTDIYKVMDYVFSHYRSCKLKKLADVFFWDEWGRSKAKEYLDKL